MINWLDPLKVDPSLSSLPVQSMAGVQPIEPPSSPGDDLNFVPSDQLKQFMLGKFDQPNIPSGIPTREQQQQAMVHRDIGNATANAAGSFQNILNIFRPGAGNPAMAESSRKYGEDLAQRALGDSQAKRQEAIQNMQLSDLSDQRRVNQMKMAQALMQDQMMKDPNSPLSKQAQARELSRLESLSSMTRDPQKLAILEQRKKMVPGVPAAMLAGAEQNDPLVKGMELESQERQAGAKLAGENSNRESEAQRRKDETSLGWARLAEEKRAHDLTGEAKNRLQLNEDKKAEEDIANLRNAKHELDRHISNLESGKVSNDKLAVYGNEASKFASSLGLPANPNAPLQDMLTSIPLAQATAEKAVTGSSRYTPQRWTQFAVQPGEGTKNSINKLKGGSRYLDELIQERMSQLHTNEKGQPVSQSAMAKSFPPNAIQNTAQAVQQQTNTGMPQSNQPQPGEIRTIKGGGKAQKQPDGSWKRIE